jgi:hypothetical protein
MTPILRDALNKQALNSPALRGSIAQRLVE